MGDDVVLLLREIEPADPERGYVPAHVFDILVEGETVGEIVLRIGETEHLKLYGGQVGYRVHPKHRGHGFASKALCLLLPIARREGIDPLWITCSPDNIASRRTLEKAGATLVEILDLPAGNDMHARGDRQKCRFRM